MIFHKRNEQLTAVSHWEKTRSVQSSPRHTTNDRTKITGLFCKILYTLIVLRWLCESAASGVNSRCLTRFPFFSSSRHQVLKINRATKVGSPSNKLQVLKRQLEVTRQASWIPYNANKKAKNEALSCHLIRVSTRLENFKARKLCSSSSCAFDRIFADHWISLKHRLVRIPLTGQYVDRQSFQDGYNQYNNLVNLCSWVHVTNRVKKIAANKNSCSAVCKCPVPEANSN